MDRLQAYRVFVKVAEQLSFSGAARELNMPNASVSTMVQDLEGLLGVRLLDRTTRRVTINAKGQVFLERCRQILSDAEDAEVMFRDAPHQIRGKVRVEVSLGMAQIIVPMLPEFIDAYPEIELELSSRDYFVDLLRDGIDCGIRSGGPSVPGVVEKTIGEIVTINCASRTYIAEYGEPTAIEDLKTHRLIHYTQSLGSRAPGFEYVDGEKTKYVRMPSLVSVNNVVSYGQACAAGLGIAQIPRIGVDAELRSGALVEVLPNHRPPPYALKLIYHEQRTLSRRVRLFMDWLAKTVAERLARG